MSYPKALKGLSKSAPQFDVTVFCETPACSCVQSWNHPCCSQTFTELELTKSRASVSYTHLTLPTIYSV